MTDLFAQDATRLFTLPPGVDFAAELLRGLEARLAGQPPQAAARVTIYVNTRRMERRLSDALQAGPARLMPRIRVLSDLANLPQVAHLPPPQPALDIRLQLMEALDRLCERAPDMAPRSAVPDLAESLAALLEEMSGEGVDPARLADLDMGAHAAHWQRSRAMLQTMADYAADPDRPPGAEGALRAAVEALAQLWATDPPCDPIIVAGSTASRGATRRFMELVTGLPQGAVVLPGVDGDLPADLWPRLAHDDAEDHPQARFARFLEGMGRDIADTAPWTDATPPAPDRNALVSLALRPAPVTDQWLRDGPDLISRLGAATEGLSLIEARGPLAEAEAIAMALRAAAQQGRRAALITPDRDLGRQVTAALDRWRIVPDDSGGIPLNQSPPGRLLREIAALESAPATLPELLTLLKHPLACTGSDSVTRGQHLLWTRALELTLRRAQNRHPQPETLARWAGDGDPARQQWAQWITQTVLAAPALDPGARAPLSQRIAAHRARAEALAAGPGAAGSGALWQNDAGEKALSVIDGLTRAAESAGVLDGFAYRALMTAILAGEEVRRGPGSHPGIAIWGTLEARVQSAELIILGGLAEGTWPARPGPDPWLSRAMRAALGLLSPERAVGLSAHDFQQAIAGREVILSRAMRDDSAQTVPARWLNRLQNLLTGLGSEGETALAQMRKRGQRWVTMAARLEAATVEALPAPARATLTPAPRPAPRPPVEVRPTRLSVTEIATLIRDPYAIYARHILRLRPLDPLMPQADPRLRGKVLHEAVSKVIAPDQPWPGAAAAADLLRAAMDAALADSAVDPAMAALWRARFAAILPGLTSREDARAKDGAPLLVEDTFSLPHPDLPLTLTARPDRIDRLNDGTFAIYDYKTRLITPNQVAHFEKQLPLQAAMLEAGAFAALTGPPPLEVTRMGYIGVGSQDADREIPRKGKEDNDLVSDTWDGLAHLITAYQNRAEGYRARVAMEKVVFSGDYDHLARFGEWIDADPYQPEDVG